MGEPIQDWVALVALWGWCAITAVVVVMRSRRRGILDMQRSSRDRVCNAAKRWAELAAAPEHECELEVGTITNRAGVRQYVTVVIRCEPLDAQEVDR